MTSLHLPTNAAANSISRCPDDAQSPPSYLKDTLIFAAVGEHAALLELHVELDDLGDPEIAQALRRTFDGGRCGTLPRFAARTDELDDLVDALCHGDPPLLVRCRHPPPIGAACVKARGSSPTESLGGANR